MTTTVRVSDETRDLLAESKEAIGAKPDEEAIRRLLRGTKTASA